MMEMAEFFSTGQAPYMNECSIRTTVHGVERACARSKPHGAHQRTTAGRLCRNAPQRADGRWALAERSCRARRYFPRHISFIETRRRQPSLTILKTVSEGLGLTMSDFVGLTAEGYGRDVRWR